MPELPEVETTRRSLLAPTLGRQILAVRESGKKLRFAEPGPSTLASQLLGARITGIERRAKYLLFRLERTDREPGRLLIHLGMSGVLRAKHHESGIGEPLATHDHLDLALEGNQWLTLNDPRRFGAALFIAESALLTHPLLAHLGPEPLSDIFTGKGLYLKAMNRSLSIKPFIMDQAIVVGVGNIYASEALFRAGIHPARAAGTVSLKRYTLLAETIRATLTEALAAGGSSIRDYRSGDGAAGFYQTLRAVYDREGLPCPRCKAPISLLRQGARASYFCVNCQR